MERSLAVGATGGSVSALILQLLSGLITSDHSFDCPVCPTCLENFQLEQLDLPSCLVGLVIGLSLGPLLDVVHLVRQSWRVWLRSRVAALEKADRTEPYYKLLWASPLLNWHGCFLRWPNCGRKFICLEARFWHWRGESSNWRASRPSALRRSLSWLTLVPWGVQAALGPARLVVWLARLLLIERLCL